MWMGIRGRGRGMGGGRGKCEKEEKKRGGGEAKREVVTFIWRLGDEVMVFFFRMDMVDWEEICV